MTPGECILRAMQQSVEWGLPFTLMADQVKELLDEIERLKACEKRLQELVMEIKHDE